jgi:hypothetical protein
MCTRRSSPRIWRASFFLRSRRRSRDGGRFVKVHGTLPADELVGIARELVRLDGAGKTITGVDDEDLPRPGDGGVPHTHGDEEPHTHDDGEVPHTHDD